MKRSHLSVPLPKGWPEVVCEAMIHVVALAHWAMIYVRGWCANSPIERVRVAGKAERAATALANRVR